MNFFESNLAAYINNLKKIIPFDLMILLLEIYPKEKNIKNEEKNNKQKMVLARLFLISICPK